MAVDAWGRNGPSGAMFRARLTSHPIAYDPEAGRAAVDALAPPAEVAALVAGAAGCSPFLAAGMAREGAWLQGLWDRAPEDLLDEVLAPGDGDMARALRVAKRRAGLVVALCELGGVWPVMQAARAWTRVADALLGQALAAALTQVGKAPVGGDGGLVAIAMGKMGAHELNHSSDIDLILLFDEARYDPGEYGAARTVLLKAARRATALLSDVTSEGYVFRTDLRLRPDPASTPIVLSFEAAERYYEAVGRTWERAAWIKARAAAGDVDAGRDFIGRLQPFVWRRHLDFAAVRDAHDMRLRIRDHKGLAGPWRLRGQDVKLGPGGIREVEFFAQTKQLVLGGRDPSLRAPGTLDALAALVAGGHVEARARDVLADGYTHLRSVEHRLQMVRDAQTHRLPGDDDGMRRLACFMGAFDPAAFEADLSDRMRAVADIAEPSYAPAAPRAAPDPIAGAEDVTARWDTYPALRSARAREVFDRLRPGLLSELSRAARPAEALAAFDAFLRGLPAGVQVLSLFEANPRLVALLADICATAPDLAAHLSREAGVLDAVIVGRFFEPLPARPALPPLPEGFETGADALRRWHREARFRIGVHHLRGLTDGEGAGRAHAGLACATLAAVWTLAEAETARRYGRIPGLQLCALGMGSLGAGRLTARSDLDLVIVHDGGRGQSDGARALGPAQWAAKFTQVLITALSAPMPHGRLYEVDMRLRPSGRQGPVATSLSGFLAYQREAAWVWEHLALTRARPVAGARALRLAAERGRRAILAEGRFDRDTVLRELLSMLDRLRAAGTKPAPLDPKAGPGRLREIELAVEAHALLAGCPARDVAGQLTVDGWLDADTRVALADAHDWLDRLRVALALLSNGGTRDLGTGGEAWLAARMGAADLAALEAEVVRRAEDARAVIEAALDRTGSAM